MGGLAACHNAVTCEQIQGSPVQTAAQSTVSERGLDEQQAIKQRAYAAD